ncbi:uncharacterized protein [Spinacia oleracea]|uniref:Aspartic peptidase DDI1-type domain-containing protein n=1 Tax=Spinacia oleracea TaxID=3562 RepID=A0ABM3R3F0_SPIOL|nr:uncharacterized protein LOC130465422 [Spinacia oleracea]
MFELNDEEELALSDEEEPEDHDGPTPDPLTRRLQFLEKQSSLMVKLMSKLPGAPISVETEPINGIKNCDVKTAIEAFKRGLIPNSELYREITKYPCAAFEEARSKACAQMRLDDDEATRTTKPRSTGGSNNRRSYTPRNNSWRQQPYNRQNQVQNFNQYNGGRISVKAGALKRAAERLGLGDLQQGEDQLGQPNANHRSEPPHYNKVVNVISGGSNMCGLTSSAAKKINMGDPRAVKEGKTENETALDKYLIAMSITFDDSDSVDAHQEHHEGLVIALPIGNTLIKRILIDNGSSANVQALQEMRLAEKNIVRRSTIFVRISGELMRTVAEISLPTYAEGVNIMTKFNVVDCPSAYNVILGRP